MLYPYPTEVPLQEAVQIVLDAVKLRVVDYKEACHAAWQIVGYGLSQWDPHVYKYSRRKKFTDKEVIQHLESLVGNKGLSDIPWNLLIPLLIQLIEKFLKKI